MKWRVTYTDKNEERYASSHVVEADSARSAVSRFEHGEFSCVHDRFRGVPDQHRATAYSKTRNYYVERV